MQQQTQTRLTNKYIITITTNQQVQEHNNNHKQTNKTHTGNQ